MGLAGTAVRELRLGGGVGDYSVRVYAGNRDQVTRRYAELFDRHRNPLSDEFQQEKKTLEDWNVIWSSCGGVLSGVQVRLRRPRRGRRVPARGLTADAMGVSQDYGGPVEEASLVAWVAVCDVGVRVTWVRNGIIA